MASAAVPRVAANFIPVMSATLMAVPAVMATAAIRVAAMHLNQIARGGGGNAAIQLRRGA